MFEVKRLENEIIIKVFVNMNTKGPNDYDYSQENQEAIDPLRCIIVSTMKDNRIRLLQNKQ